MNEVIFGSIWFIFSFIMFGVFLSNEFSLGIFLMALLFCGIGITVIVIGIKEIIRNSKTEKNGEECFGKIISVDNTEPRVNESKLYSAQVMVYVGSECEAMLVSEKIGFDPSLYEIGTYVKVKYYLGDINFISSVSENSIPLPIKNAIDDKTNNNFEYVANKTNTSNFENSTYVSPENQAKALKVVGAFLILFSLVFMSFLIGFYTIFNTISNLPADHYYVNGEEVTREEFEEESNSNSLFVTVMMGTFGMIGMVIMAAGVKLCLTKKPENEDALVQNNTNNEYDTDFVDNDDPIKKY